LELPSKRDALLRGLPVLAGEKKPLGREPSGFLLEDNSRGLIMSHNVNFENHAAIEMAIKKTDFLKAQLMLNGRLQDILSQVILISESLPEGYGDLEQMASDLEDMVSAIIPTTQDIETFQVAGCKLLGVCQ
jgi:hypothetical protein